MGRAGRKPKPRPALQPIAQYEHNLAVADLQARIEIITPQMRAKGTYRVAGRSIVNAHDPVERWKLAGKLEQRQLVVIEMVQRLWRLAGLSQRVTASYGERMPAGVTYELRAITEIEAREDLHRIQDYVPAPYWAVFESCCRHGIAAGIAGKHLGFGTRSAQDRAHQVVCFVTDIIAMKERV